MGEVRQADRIVVRWPNGDVTFHGPWNVGRHVIEQPK
ncbi:MAG: hypothetical protein ACON4U_07120 [Myxococcota bacterium]